MRSKVIQVAFADVPEGRQPVLNRPFVSVFWPVIAALQRSFRGSAKCWSQEWMGPYFADAHTLRQPWLAVDAMIVLETERLLLRYASVDDAGFVLTLLNEPSFLRFIGDRGVRTLDDARRYIVERFIDSYERNGFGLWVVERKKLPGPIGICGLVKREALPDPDIGFAFLPAFWSAGYAYESAMGVKVHALQVLGLTKLLAVTNLENVKFDQTCGETRTRVRPDDCALGRRASGPPLRARRGQELSEVKRLPASMSRAVDGGVVAIERT